MTIREPIRPTPPVARPRRPLPECPAPQAPTIPFDQTYEAFLRAGGHSG